MKRSFLAESLRKIEASRAFSNATFVVILFAALLMGLEAIPSILEEFGSWLDLGLIVSQAYFIVEILIRILANRSNLRAFFRDGWNLFDVSVVLISLLPVAGPWALAARLARILRVARLVSSNADLRLIIDTMLKSIPSLGHVSMLLGILLYIYGVVGHHLFGRIDPQHWGSLSKSLLSLFKVLTLEAWVEMLESVSESATWAWAYFVSFILIAVFVVVNLFIAVVINNLQSVKSLRASESS